MEYIGLYVCIICMLSYFYIEHIEYMSLYVSMYRNFSLGIGKSSLYMYIGLYAYIERMEYITQ